MSLICPSSRMIHKTIASLAKKEEGYVPCNPKSSKIICLPYLWYSLSDKLGVMVRDQPGMIVSLTSTASRICHATFKFKLT